MNVLPLPSTLTHAQAPACRSEWVRALRAAPAGTAWQLDASALKAFDSSALAVLLACRREALALGQAWQVTHMPPRLRELAGLYGVMPLLEG